MHEWQRRINALGQFRVADPSVPVLSKEDEHHLRKVLRARDGEEVVVTNGRGAWAMATITPTSLERVTEVVLDEQRVETILYMVPLKGDHSEIAVAKATELGVSKIVPLLSQRIAVKFKGDVRDKVLARWRRIASEAAGQCRRTYDIEIAEPITIDDVPADVAVTDFGGQGEWHGVRAVAVGPEGGWAPGEWGDDRLTLSLGSTVLRAETAILSSAVRLTMASGDIPSGKSQISKDEEKL